MARLLNVSMFENGTAQRPARSAAKVKRPCVLQCVAVFCGVCCSVCCNVCYNVM